MRILAITTNYNQATQAQNKRNINFEAALVPKEFAASFKTKFPYSKTLGKILSEFKYVTSSGEQIALYPGTVLEKLVQGVKAKSQGNVYLNKQEIGWIRLRLDNLRQAIQITKKENAIETLNALWGAQAGAGKEARDVIEGLVKDAERNRITMNF